MRALKGLVRALNDSGRFRYKVRSFWTTAANVLNCPAFQEPEYVVDYLVVGGGTL